jgi:hypothetical protein
MKSDTPALSPLYLPEGICRVCEVAAQEDFVFCVNGENYSVPLAEAVFLSPRVFSLLKSDITIRFFKITDRGIDQRHFEPLLEIVRGRRVRVAGSSRLSFAKLSSQLGNTSLIQLYLGLGDGDTVIEPVYRASSGFDLTVYSRESLLSLNFATLAQIVGSDTLRIESEDWLLDFIIELGDEYRDLMGFVKYDFLSAERLRTFLDEFDYRDMSDEIWTSLVRRLRGEMPTGENPNRYRQAPAASPSGFGFSSTIVSEFPAVLSVIEAKNARLLYRGTRDGFASSNCQSLVVGHSNLLIIVETTEGWIFGGYAHCKWPENDWVGDPSWKSFLFTLKNPHNIHARRFGMTSNGKDHVLYAYPSGGAVVWMGYSGAIGLLPEWNRNSKSHNNGFADWNCSSNTFENDSGHVGETLFTGSRTYTVKEVEIFEFW